MKFPLLSAAFVACALLSGRASALMIYGGNACDPLGGTADLDYYRLDNGFVTIGANSVSGYVSCPMSNMRNGTNGLSYGYLRFRVTNSNSNCTMRAMTMHGSVVSGNTTMLTTINSDQSWDIGQGVTSSTSTGMFTLGCIMSGGSQLYSYRYEEAP